MNKEIRSTGNLEIRKINEEDESLILEGYIAKFNTYTELWEGFNEKIDRNAFKDTLEDGHNIYLIYNHDISKVLASTRNNTLILEADEVGLKFRATINRNLTYAKDVYELVKSGEVRGCSFGFRCLEEDVNYNSEKDEINRTLLKIELIEGTVTPIPAYESSEVQARAKEIKDEELKKIQNTKELRELKNELELIEMELEL